MSFPNVWHHRKVAETARKCCDLCNKLSASVLITPDNKDFFYICPTHLKETSFCSPIIDHEAVAARKKKEEEAAEIEKLKKEYEEKQRKKKEKEAKEKGKDEEEDKDKEQEKDKAKAKKEEDAKEPADQAATKTSTNTDDEPRTFTLTKNYYQKRVVRKRQAERTQRTREQLRDPNFFPAVPKH